MDAVTLALAKAYTNSQRLAYIDTPVPFTFDGDPTGKQFSGGYMLISPAWDLSAVVRVFVRDSSGDVMTATKEDGTLSFDEGRITLFGEIPAVFNSDGVTALFCNIEQGIYITKVEFAETIHPIDPKFLPGVCLPIVTLTTVVSEEENVNTAFTTDESALLDSVANIGDVVIINVQTSSTLGAMPVLCRCIEADGLIALIGYCVSSAITLFKQDGTWIAFIG